MTPIYLLPFCSSPSFFFLLRFAPNFQRALAEGAIAKGLLNPEACAWLAGAASGTDFSVAGFFQAMPFPRQSLLPVHRAFGVILLKGRKWWFGADKELRSVPESLSHQCIGKRNENKRTTPSCK